MGAWLAIKKRDLTHQEDGSAGMSRTRTKVHLEHEDNPKDLRYSSPVQSEERDLVEGNLSLA